MAIDFIGFDNQVLLGMNYALGAEMARDRLSQPAFNFNYRTGVDKLSSRQFGQAIYAPMFSAGYGTDAFYIACGLDLDRANSGYSGFPYSFSDWQAQNPVSFQPVFTSLAEIRPVRFEYAGPSASASAASGSAAAATGSGSAATAGSSTVSAENNSDVTNPNTKNDDKTKYNRKVKLAEEYIKKQSGDEVKANLTEKLNKAKTVENDDYAKAIQELDKFLKTLTPATLISITHEMYKEDFKERYEAACNIAKPWLDKISGATTGSFEVDMSGVNANNILDVLGSFLANDTSETANWDTLIVNNYQKIKQLLVEKANQIKNSIDDDSLKTKITNAVAALPETVSGATDKETSTKLYKLFDILRKYQSEQNDKDVYQRYGLPADVTLTNEQEKASKIATEFNKNEKNSKVGNRFSASA